MNAPVVRKRWKNVDGVVMFDKPQGLSSNDALQKVRRLFSAAKAGHTGTLDPMATGLLPICFGEATKFSNRLLESDKTYEAVMRLGQTSSTGDAEGEILRVRPVDVSADALAAIPARFMGEQMQLPPMYSALKHQGKALYDYARAGVEIEREPRPIRILALSILWRQGNDVAFSVTCSKGTYVRTLAEDIGEVLGCGAHLVALRRTAIGCLDVGQAHTLDSLALLSEEERVAGLAPADALIAHLPAVTLDESASRWMQHGQAAKLVVPAGEYRICGHDGRFLGLGESDGLGMLRPVRLLVFKDPE